MKNVKILTVAALLFLVALLPRVTGLNTFLTADEATWIERSHEFVRAFHDGRFNDMLQTTHPGVTTMWTAGLAIAVKEKITGVAFSDETFPYFIKTAQFSIAFLNALAIPAGYLLLRRAWKVGELFPFLASLFLALDPFVIGYSRVAHVDALLMSFLWIAVLAIIIYIREGYSRTWLVISAVLSCLALLTKAPAVVLLPFMVTAMLWTSRRLRWKDLSMWLGIIFVMFVLLWPAVLFVPDPKGNALVFKRDLGAAIVTPHDTTEDYNLDAWHYPKALLIRTTPVLLVLSIAGLGAVWFKRKQLNEEHKQVVYLMLIYALGFFVMMTIGAKKGDRYILPLWAALNFLAAFGIFAWLRTWLRSAVAVVAVGTLVFTILHYHPYEISYSDPFLPDNLSQSLGWGEGLDQVGAWLNINAPHAVVASWYPSQLAPYTTAGVQHITAHEQRSIGYIVLYRNMFGREPAHYANDFIDEYYKKWQPVHVVSIVGKPFAWVYKKPVYDRLLNEFLPGATAVQALDVPYANLVAGFDVQLATYSGRATTGSLILTLRDSLNGKQLARWDVPVKSIKDTGWTTVRFEEPQNLTGKKVFMEFVAQGTSSGDAPAIRYANQASWRPNDNFYYKAQGSVSQNDKKTGNIAIRLRYVGNDGQEATEEEVQLLH